MTPHGEAGRTASGPVAVVSGSRRDDEHGIPPDDPPGCSFADG